ncbi:unnamed protein product [Paramecium octaurelia]|uniref:Transmembrane protein n=1 Tax=Paramecium octaurelia TaxID=43137 RepID=A0A8S1TBG6_PAROT|nr:unnamed protein product [Paramecium octaurelia]
MLLILYFALIKAQIYTHTFLILDQQNSIGVPNYLNRQLISTSHNYIPNLQDQEVKKNILNSNFSNYFNNTRFSYGKTKLNPEITFVKNQAIVVYYQYQNLLSNSELKEQYNELKKYYFTDEFYIIIHHKVDKHLTENILFSTNPAKYIKEFSQNLDFIEFQQQYNFTNEVIKLVNNKSQCQDLQSYISSIRDYNQFKQIKDKFQQINQIQQWIDGWIISNNTKFAQLLFDQHITAIEELLNQFQTSCQSSDLIFQLNIDNYQYTIISICLIMFIVIKHFAKQFTFNDDKDKFV